MKLLNASLLSLVSPLSGPWATDSLLQQFLTLARHATPCPPLPPPSLPLDVYEDSHSLLAVLEVPGVPKEQLHITLHSGRLQVSVEPSQSSPDQTPSTRQSRSIQLPPGLQPESISASLQDGRLILTLPKPSPSNARTIPIN